MINFRVKRVTSKLDAERLIKIETKNFRSEIVRCRDCVN